MPESDPERAATDARLRVEVARAVAAVDGVLRIEPTLNGLLRRVPGHLRRDRNDPADPEAVQIKTFGSITDVSLDVAVRGSGQALASAEAVEQVVGAVLADHDREPGRVRIGVLAIEYPDPTRT